MAAELSNLGAETHAARQVKKIAPWVVSLLLHIGIVVLGLLITWTVSNLPKKDDSIVVIADFNALNYEPVAQMSATPEAASERQAQDRAQSEPIENVIRDQLSDASQNVTDMLAGSTQAGAPALSQFAPRAKTNGAAFAGTSSSNARSIVYVIDASGSMISHMQIVLDELARSLEALNPKQSFSVIFFQQNKALAVPPANKLLAATDDEKVRALQWIGDNVVPQGRSNPLMAIELAMSHKPDVVFILSEGITGSGEFEIDQRDLLLKLGELNPVDIESGRRHTQINCIQFLDPDPIDTLKLIAQDHGGANGYKFLSRAELGLGDGQ